MEQTELSQKLALSALLTDVTLPGEKVSTQVFRCGQIVSDTPRGIPSIGLITRGRIEVYSVALDGKDILLNELSAGECFGICNLLAQSELETVLRCSVETEILYIPKAVLLESMAADGTLALRFEDGVVEIYQKSPFYRNEYVLSQKPYTVTSPETVVIEGKEYRISFSEDHKTITMYPAFSFYGEKEIWHRQETNLA